MKEECNSPVPKLYMQCDFNSNFKRMKILDGSRVIEGLGIEIILSLSPVFTNYKLCDSGQVTQLLCALISTIDGR